ncbi:GH32 C-terminal domain-containing protein [Clostridium arbusti]|uniref:GH32 C-terminal domain-containing protein n=1 Tax=Clostridium arbusti TaxID=1137848 RepID=UPI001FB15D35|nr:GH32 C-terminal domain-containing protein [Clostridium arbusti]
MEPAEELQVLRKNHKKYENIDISESWMPETKGKALEIIAEFNINDDIKEFTIDILASKDNEEKTSIVYSTENNRLSVDRNKSSASNLTDQSKLGTDFSLEEGETLKLHIFIDYSTVEVFANYRKCISTRVYPIKVDSENIKISILEGDKLKLKSFDIWEMNSI